MPEPSTSSAPRRESTEDEHEPVVYTLSLRSAAGLSMPPTFSVLRCCGVSCAVPFFWGRSCGRERRCEVQSTAAGWVSGSMAVLRSSQHYFPRYRLPGWDTVLLIWAIYFRHTIHYRLKHNVIFRSDSENVRLNSPNRQCLR